MRFTFKRLYYMAKEKVHFRVIKRHFEKKWMNEWTTRNQTEWYGERAALSQYKQRNWQGWLVFDLLRWYCRRTASQLTRARSSRGRTSLNFVHTSTLIHADARKDRKVSDFRPVRDGEPSWDRKSVV